MAIFNCIYHSQVLGTKTAMNVVLPDREDSSSPAINEIPVFTLLHGFDGNYLTWAANTKIQELAEKLGVAVIMPEAKNSFYTKTSQGEDYYTHIAEELPLVARRFFNLSAERELNHIAGISMGGFGAMKIGLLKGKSFATIGCLSAVFDIQAELFENPRLTQREKDVFTYAFGQNPQLRGTENDLMWLARQVAGKDLPWIYQFCGTEDFLYSDNRRFCNLAVELRLKHSYKEGPGKHLWPVWAEQIWDYIPWAIAK